MALPKISFPTFECVQPSTGNVLMYRPFRVKEEKILLFARESGEKKDIFNAVKQIINNCVVTEGFEVNDVPIFDMEYLFIKIRSVSVGNIVNFQVEDSDDKITYNLELNLDEVEVQVPENQDRKIMIDDNIGVILRHPTPEITDKIANLETITEVTYETIRFCIEATFDENNVYSWPITSEQEQTEFLDSLPVLAYKKIQQFFTTSPKIEHIVFYENSLGQRKRVVFRNLNDFFTLY
jgi:hypothetical protein